MIEVWGCASLNDCGWTGPNPMKTFCPNCGGFVAQRLSASAREFEIATVLGTAGQTEYASWAAPSGVALPDGGQTV